MTSSVSIIAHNNISLVHFSFLAVSHHVHGTLHLCCTYMLVTFCVLAETLPFQPKTHFERLIYSKMNSYTETYSKAMDHYQAQITKLGEQAKVLKRQLCDENVRFHRFVSEVLTQIATRNRIKHELHQHKVHKRQQATSRKQLRRSTLRKAMFGTRPKVQRSHASAALEKGLQQHQTCVQGKKNIVNTAVQHVATMPSSQSVLPVVGNLPSTSTDATHNIELNTTRLDDSDTSVPSTEPVPATSNVSPRERGNDAGNMLSDSDGPLQRTSFRSILGAVNTDTTYKPQLAAPLVAPAKYVWRIASNIAHERRKACKEQEYIEEVVNKVPQDRMEATLAAVPFDAEKPMDLGMQINVGYVCVACPVAKRHPFQRHTEVTKHIRNVHFYPKGFRCVLCKQSFAQRGHVKRHLTKSHFQNQEEVE